MKIYLLTCNDASSLGGPMGTEREVAMWTRPYSTLALAKAHAEAQHLKEKPDWYRHSTGSYSWDYGGRTTYDIDVCDLDGKPPK